MVGQHGVENQLNIIFQQISIAATTAADDDADDADDAEVVVNDDAGILLLSLLLLRLFFLQICFQVTMDFCSFFLIVFNEISVC